MEITHLTKSQANKLLDGAKVKNRLTPEALALIKEKGWKVDNYALEKKYKGYYIVIEFCFGDFCTYICSKKGKWLLEAKYRCETFFEALATAARYQTRIDNKEHWKGEDD